MFTGIVTDVGRVRAVRDTNRDRRFEIETSYDLAGVDLGASISHAGCCLTVVDKGQGWFAVEVSSETLAMTTLGAWKAGTRINLERAARAGDEMGGHIVSGHVDGEPALALGALSDALRFRRLSVEALGDDLWERYEKL